MLLRQYRHMAWSKAAGSGCGAFCAAFPLMLAAMIPCHNYQILKVRIIRMWDWIVQILFQALELIQRFAGDWGL